MSHPSLHISAYPCAAWMRNAFAGVAFCLMRLLVIQLHPAGALANPDGGSVASGAAGISSGPGQVTVRQTSDRAVVNWNGFSIGNGETTTFVQPSSSSTVLNRVTGGGVSRLDGNLNANGQVYLVNRNGVVVGKTGRVNTAGFTASTHDVANAEFMRGGDLTFSGNSSASIINQGKIRATDGDVTLIARHVENQGRITARKGSVNLAGGTEVLVKPSGSDGQRVYIRGTSGSGTVANSGSIRAAAAELRAAGGNEYALAVNNTGVIRASTVDRQGGRIVLRAERGNANSGTVQNSGRLVASPGTRSRAGSTGGSIVVTGEHVRLSSTSRMDTSSNVAGGKGGTVSVGGGFQGKDAAIANAKSTTVEAGSVINADGGIPGTGTDGKGGTVIIWSDETTSFLGSVTARGPGGHDASLFGTAQSTGGFVEVSGKSLLDFRGTVDTAGGTLLLDPDSITISTAATSGAPLVHPSGTSSVLNVAELVTLLQSGAVVLQASSFITVNSQIAHPTVGNNLNNLRLEAPTLNLNAPIILGTGVLSGTATLVNVGVAGRVRNGVDAAAATGPVAPIVNLGVGAVAATTYSEFNINITKAITINGNSTFDTTITAEFGPIGSRRVMIVDPGAATVTLNRISLTGGSLFGGDGAAILLNSGNLTVTRCSIFDNSAPLSSGGGISGTVEGTLSISDSSFFENSAHNGGAVATTVLNGGTVVINASSFTGNSAANGGAIYNDVFNATFEINGSTFTSNTASLYAGGIYSVLSGSASLRVNGSAFVENTGANTGGVVITAADFSTVSIVNSSFTENTGNTGGGGIIISSSSMGTQRIAGSSFGKNTSALRGGGIFVSMSRGKLELTNSTFTENRSTILGGGAYIELSGTAISEITGCAFTQNAAYSGGVDSSDGGGIYGAIFGTSKLEITNSTFTGNTTESEGAGIYIYFMNQPSLKITGSTFTSNIAGDTGGGIGLSGDFNSVAAYTAVEIANSTFTGNQTTFGGGGIYMTIGSIFTPVAKVSISNSSFAQNSVSNAGAYGAGIFSYSPGIASIDIINSSFTENTAAYGGAGAYFALGITALNISGASFTRNGGSVGAGLWLEDLDSTAVVSNSTFTQNTTDAPGGQGGGMFIRSHTSLGMVEINGSTFTGNRARSSGGGIHVAGPAGLIVTGSTFANNIALNPATSRGGAIHFESQGTSEINTSSFTGNQALSGGGMSIADGLVKITNSTLANNVTATSGNGGGINVFGSGRLELTNSTVSGNVSSNRGGGLYINSGGSTKITSSTIAGNSSMGSGGGIDVAMGDVVILSSIIAGNTAATSGPNVNGTITDAGYNLIGNTTGSFGFGTGPDSTVPGMLNRTDAEVGLLPLDFYGGPTKTMALLPTSLAINAGDPLLTGADQRGVPMFGGRRDIGAYESEGFTSLVILANSVTKTYGDLDPALTFGFELGALQPGDTLGTVFTGALSREAGIDVGTYDILQSNLGLSNYGRSRYSIVSFSGADRFVIDPRVLTITPDGLSKLPGETDPTFTFTFSNLASFDTPDGVFAGTLGRDPGEGVGSYNITLGTLGTLSSRNYRYILNRRSFTIIGEPNPDPAPDPSPDPAPNPTLNSNIFVAFNATRGRNNEDFMNPNNMILLTIPLQFIRNYNISYQAEVLGSALHIRPFQEGIFHMSSFDVFGPSGPFVTDETADETETSEAP